MDTLKKYPRVAIVHYWLVGMRGGERVLERLLHLYPQADIITHVYDREAVSEIIRDRKVITTFINKLPGAQKHYQKYLPLMPAALEEVNLRGYDLVISSESGPAKGVITAPDALHICYCHSPMRYLWDHYHDYRSQAGVMSRTVMPPLFHYLRMWDISTAARIDSVVANSNFIRKRIKKSWGRDASVVYPPVATDLFQPSNDVSDKYLWVGQMTPYKRADIVVDAFNELKAPLLMIGKGELSKSIARRAKSNITILPHVSFEELRQAYANCRALIFPAEEDFGIIPVEANAAGRPVIAYGKGGAAETIIDRKTGIFFKEQTALSLTQTITEFESWLPHFDPGDAIENASRFSTPAFDENMRAAISAAERDCA
ncbi:glycosyltransferase [Marinicaulis aureus]|uniref:Glycosyltransferase n=1 Tax=Hyphococcus aureus TaxID=2666033 RepID=A0ABW1KWH4_9PROT